MWNDFLPFWDVLNGWRTVLQGRASRRAAAVWADTHPEAYLVKAVDTRLFFRQRWGREQVSPPSSTARRGSPSTNLARPIRGDSLSLLNALRGSTAGEGLAPATAAGAASTRVSQNLPATPAAVGRVGGGSGLSIGADALGDEHRQCRWRRLTRPNNILVCIHPFILRKSDSFRHVFYYSERTLFLASLN